MSKIIRAQVKDRSMNNGEWSEYVVGKNGVEDIELGSYYDAVKLRISKSDGGILLFFNVAFFIEYSKSSFDKK